MAKKKGATVLPKLTAGTPVVGDSSRCNRGDTDWVDRFARLIQFQQEWHSLY
jgi:hypothetical protein